MIHRDVKPSNVLIGDDGTAKLADLGIATAVDATSITTTNDIIGTLSYIAPERLENADDDPSADVYSLAAVAFEALSGQRAQQGQTPTEIVARQAIPAICARSGPRPRPRPPRCCGRGWRVIRGAARTAPVSWPTASPPR